MYKYVVKDREREGEIRSVRREREEGDTEVGGLRYREREREMERGMERY